MAEGISIKENGDLLKKIVAEKGFFGYKNRYYLILQEIIKRDTVYEELSDESKAILHQETGLDEEKIKVMSELVYGKPVPDEADAEQKPLLTKIGFVLSLLPYRNNYPDKPLPEEVVIHPLEVYIGFLNLSTDMLKYCNGQVTSKEIVFQLKSLVKTYCEKNYARQIHSGLIKLFNDSMVLDWSLYRTAKTYERGEALFSDENSPVLKHVLSKNSKEIVEYLNFRYAGNIFISGNLNQFFRQLDYIDFAFKKDQVKDFFEDSKPYSDLFSKLTDELRDDFSVEALEAYKNEVAELIKRAKGITISNIKNFDSWHKILLDNLNILKKWLANKSRKSDQSGLNAKMRLYLLNLLVGTSLDGEVSNKIIHKIYASVLDIREGNVKNDFARLHETNLGYEVNYSLRIHNLKKVYYLIGNLGDKTRDKKYILDRIIEDMIPRKDSLNKSWKAINDAKFGDAELENKVRQATQDYHDNCQKDAENRALK